MILSVPSFFWSWKPVSFPNVLMFCGFDQTTCIKGSIFGIILEQVPCGHQNNRFDVFHLLWCQDRDISDVWTSFNGMRVVGEVVDMDGEVLDNSCCDSASQRDLWSTSVNFVFQFIMSVLVVGSTTSLPWVNLGVSVKIFGVKVYMMLVIDVDVPVGFKTIVWVVVIRDIVVYEKKREGDEYLV